MDISQLFRDFYNVQKLTFRQPSIKIKSKYFNILKATLVERKLDIITLVIDDTMDKDYKIIPGTTKRVPPEKDNAILFNQIELLNEDIECVNKYLDEKKIPRTDGKEVYSLVGRIKLLEKKLKK